jgi:hypothetical protein
MRILLRSGLLALATAASAAGLSAQTPAVVVDSTAAPASAAPAAPAAPARPAQRSTSTRLVGADINDAPYTNLYDLVRARRPRWLRTRMVGARGQVEVVQVVVDNGAPMSVDALRTLAPADVDRMEFRDSFDATGSGSAQYTYAGTIYVWMKR